MQDLQRHRLTIKYYDANGDVVEKKYGAKTLDSYEFVGQGKIFFIQNVITPKSELLKTHKVELQRDYIPVDKIISLDIVSSIEFSDSKDVVEFAKRML